MPVRPPPHRRLGAPTRRRPSRARCAASVAALIAACGPSQSVLVTVDAGPGADAGAADAGLPDGGPAIPLDLLRALPDRGPFTGGQAVVLRGAGFRSSAVAVWFGDVPVPAVDVRRIDPNRLEVVAPPSPPGVVDVVIDDGEARRTLVAGYTYESVAVAPGAGPPAGGTRLRVRAASDAFEAGATVRLGGLRCEPLEVVGPREATCRTPPHPLGAVDVEVEAAGATLTLPGAFVYENPFRAFGGLGGGPLDGTLTVLVRGFDQAPLEGALVLAGAGGAFPHRAVTGRDGTVVFTGDALRGRIDLFVSHPCHHHAGFLGLDAAYATAGMRLARLGCLAGGGTGLPVDEVLATVSGEVVFFEGAEFPAPVWEWAGVPRPGPGQRRVAYVGLASPRDLLSGDGTSAAVAGPVVVTEATRGARGYPFVFERARAGTTLGPFAVAGLEPTDGGAFEAHVVGLGAPVLVPPGGARTGLEIAMDTPLGPGREVSAAVPSDVPPLFFEERFELAPAPLDRLQLLVRYAVPGLAAGLPLGLGPDAEEPRGPLGAVLAIARQPRAVGSFAAAEQEVFAVYTGGPSSSSRFDDRPHTRVLVRGPLDTSPLLAEGFLGIPRFTAPADTGEPLPADRTLRFTVADADGATLIRATVSRPFTEGFALVWFLLAHPSVRAITLPDLREEVGFEPLPAGQQRLEVSVLDVPALDFDRIDTRAIDALPVRRSALNRIGFVVE